MATPRNGPAMSGRNRRRAILRRSAKRIERTFMRSFQTLVGWFLFPLQVSLICLLGLFIWFCVEPTVARGFPRYWIDIAVANTFAVLVLALYEERAFRSWSGLVSGLSSLFFLTIVFPYGGSGILFLVGLAVFVVALIAPKVTWRQPRAFGMIKQNKPEVGNGGNVSGEER
jgi:hypothetical protein